MDTVTAKVHLERAQAGIRQAMAEWDPTGLDRVEESREMLAAAVGEMRAFESAVRLGTVFPSGELCATLLAVKQEIVQATRVVDACVAFHRGLAARIGDAGPGYDAKGRFAGNCAELEPGVHA
jgi:hypothetical protein